MNETTEHFAAADFPTNELVLSGLREMVHRQLQNDAADPLRRDVSARSKPSIFQRDSNRKPHKLDSFGIVGFEGGIVIEFDVDDSGWTPIDRTEPICDND